VSIKTRELLVELKFEPTLAEFTSAQPGYCYRFGNLDLQAVEVTNEYLRPVMMFSGVKTMPSSFESVQLELPMELDSFEQGVALIAHAIGPRFTPLEATAWLEQGRLWEDHLPGRVDLRLFQQRPKCHVEAAWFRVALKKLRMAAEGTPEGQEFLVGFREDVLRIELPSEVVALPASGKPWPKMYRAGLKGLSFLSKRTPAEGVELDIWKGHITIGRLRLPVVDVQLNETE
jgi:hypothetical protein